jgi:hypothetical protein
MTDKLTIPISVTFDTLRRGYVGAAPQLCPPVAALSLGILRTGAARLPRPTTPPHCQA